LSRRAASTAPGWSHDAKAAALIEAQRIEIVVRRRQAQQRNSFVAKVSAERLDESGAHAPLRHQRIEGDKLRERSIRCDPERGQPFVLGGDERRQNTRVQQLAVRDDKARRSPTIRQQPVDPGLIFGALQAYLHRRRA
jgi:hypothetical protein